MRLFENESVDTLLDQLCEYNINPVFLLSTDAALTVYKASADTENLLQKLRSEVIGSAFLDQFPPEASKNIKSVLRRCKRAKVTQNHLVELLGSEKKTIFIDFIASFVTVGNSEFYFVQCENKTEETIYLQEVEKMNAQLSHLSSRDELTGLSTKRYFTEQFDRELVNLRKDHTALVVVLFDIDNFKEYNDINGHEVGNKALRELANILEQEFSSEGFLARVGGEEFSFYCNSLGKDHAVSLINNALKRVVRFPFENAQAQPLGFFSLSSSITEVKVNEGVVEVFKRLEEGIIKAKKAGRNQLIIAD